MCKGIEYSKVLRPTNAFLRDADGGDAECEEQCIAQSAQYASCAAGDDGATSDVSTATLSAATSLHQQSAVGGRSRRRDVVAAAGSGPATGADADFGRQCYQWPTGLEAASQQHPYASCRRSGCFNVHGQDW